MKLQQKEAGIINGTGKELVYDEEEGWVLRDYGAEQLYIPYEPEEM